MSLNFDTLLHFILSAYIHISKMMTDFSKAIRPLPALPAPLEMIWYVNPTDTVRLNAVMIRISTNQILT